MKFLKANPLIAGIIGLVLVVAVISFFTFRDVEKKRVETKLEEKGAVTERAKQSEVVLTRTQEANDEREKIARNDDNAARLLYEQCLRSARTPANCKRLLPERPAD